MLQQNIFSETHKNHYLFSDHYLNNILPKLDIWQESLELVSVKNSIQKLYLKVLADLPHSNEAQLERDFIQPVLKTLGHFFEIQAPIHGTQLFRPDYTFFRSESERKEAKKLQGKKEYFEHAIAIGDAKSWDRPLDRRIKKHKDIDDYSNPSVQINNYLIATSQKWGILTNGRLWRLYNKDTSFSLDNFYQVDLVRLIEQDEAEALKYFYLLFRREAFESYNTQPSFLDFVYNQSESYRVELEKDVNARMYEALRVLANGFLKYPRNNLHPIQDQQAIHDNCLILLYRMLFVFYAEARQLMPDHPEYKRNFSFDNMKKQIRERTVRSDVISPITTEYWGKLQALFMLLNDPQGMYDMPQYNGGLFNPQNHPFLEKYQIGDQAMAEAFELVANARTNNEYGFVDYRTLDVQHLGSIYEGLLEYKLEFADQDKVVVKKNKKQEIIANKVNHPELPVAYPRGDYYLVTDKGERKATGSYYTPDYIVRYIVENTLQPLVDKCDHYGQILDLNVLDPAMGSGHFLVGVVDFLAEQILYHPTTPLLDEGDEEKEIAHWRRRVVERCVYGVDINPLAMELAKLSLWLHSLAHGKPLSFLDHHLRCGNSLIGARVKELHELPDLKRRKAEHKLAGEQITIFENRFLQQVKLAVGHYLLIEQMETKTKQDVDKKEELLKVAEEHLQKFKKIANVWISAYFGNELTRDAYHVLLDAIQENRFKTMPNLKHFQKAQKIAEEKCFFHWEMEFPDVFFDDYGRWLDNPGFDCVLGNPPYFTVQRLVPDERIYLKYSFPDMHSGQNDIWFYFVAIGKYILKNKHIISFINPRYYLEAKHASLFRGFLARNFRLKQIVDFENFQVFEEVNTLALINSFIKNDSDNFELIGKVYRFVSDFALTSEKINLSKILEEYETNKVVLIEVRNKELTAGNWSFLSTVQQRIGNIFGKVETIKMDILAEIGQGMTSGLNSAFIVNEEEVEKFSLERDKLIPYIKTIDIKRYELRWRGEYLIYIKPSENINDFPYIKKHLLNYRTELEKRYKYNDSKWYTLSVYRNVEILESKRLKIFTPLYSTSNKFVLSDEKQHGILTDVYAILPKENLKYSTKYILGVLNSKLLKQFHYIYGKLKRDQYYEYSTGILSNYPIRKINFKYDSDLRKIEQKRIIDLLWQNFNKTKEELIIIIFEQLQKLNSNITPLIQHDLIDALVSQVLLWYSQKSEQQSKYRNWLKIKTELDIDKLGQTLAFDYQFLSVNEYLKQIDKKKKNLTSTILNQIKFEFTQSVSFINSLITSIEKTDWLIDQIVYRLYELTEEEIRMVEESVK